MSAYTELKPSGGVQVTYLDAVRGQKQDTLKVLQLSQKYTHKRVSVNVHHIALFKEHIRLIQQ